MTAQPVVAREPWIVVALVLREDGLNTFFTGLPNSANVVGFNIPVSACPNYNVVNNRVWTVYYVGHVVGGLTVEVERCIHAELVAEAYGVANVEVVGIELGIWNNTFLVGIRKRKPNV